MSEIRVPSFLHKLPKTKKIELLKQWKTLQGYECIDLMLEYYETELEKSISRDEKDNFPSWFQTKWSRAKRLGKRLVYRQIIKDLK